MDLIITLDTEDTYNPPEAGMDGVPKTLADILSEEGIPANFIIVARRAKQLRERGRADVIAALKRHTVGVHTLAHEQPVAAVQVADLDWHSGLEVCRRLEGEAYRAVAEVFGCQPACLSTHHSYEAPQAFVVARELGVPYLYGHPAAPPLYGISRYCGALNIAMGSPPPGGAPVPYFEGFDDTLADVPAFEKHLERFAQHLDSCLAAGQPAFLLHPCHPFKTYTLDWIQTYITPNGVNIPPDRWRARRAPGLRTPAQVDMVLRNFRRLARFIARHPHLNVVTIPQAAARYGAAVPSHITRLDLLASAQRIGALNQVAIEERFSAAEVLLAFAGALQAFAHAGRLPDDLPRENDILGPLEDPLILPEEFVTLGWPALLDLAAELLRLARVGGHLPANLAVAPGVRAGLGTVYRALADAYLTVYEGSEPPDGLPLRQFDRQPRLGPALGHQYTTMAESRLVPPGLPTDRLYRYAKLQTWTLAPAWIDRG